MSTVYKGVFATNAAATIPTLTEQGKYGGKVRKMIDSYVLVGDLVANDTILMGTQLPEGAIVTNARLYVPAMGGSCALSFGWAASTEIPVGNVGVGGTVLQAADTTAFFNNFVVSSAQNVAANAQVVQSGGSGDFYMKTIAGPGCQPVVTCNVASSGATAAKVQIEIDYIIE